MTLTGFSVKNAAASSTDMSSTSAMFLPAQPIAEDLIGESAALAHLAHRLTTPAMKARSV